MFHQGSGHRFSSYGRICQVCCPSNRQHVSVCQSGASSWTQYTIHDTQLFVWGIGRAAYAFWSLAGLPRGNLVVWGERGAPSSSCKKARITHEKGGATRGITACKSLFP
eukprot:15008983-Ditylum_brightwellii.AAC.1